MKAVLLDGSGANDVAGERIRAVLTARLRAQGWDVEHVALRDKKISPCAGDFFCWIRTPGVCSFDDDNRVIAAALVACDLAVYLTPITFGGYSSVLKRMVDHQIQNVSPLFARIAGETHHQKRYSRYPDLLAVGWMDAADARSAAVFRHLVQRNARNFHAQTCVCDVVLTSQSDQELLVSAQGWLRALQDGRSSAPVELPPGVTASGACRIWRALVVVASPKGHHSNSNSLGGYLVERLSARSIHTETSYLYLDLRSAERMQALLDAMDAADLVTLTFPLYVDSLPAPVIEFLERVAAHRHGRAVRPQLFAAVANCGFPESHHTATALAICETFAQQAKFVWAGSLGLGGGEVINGAPLVAGGGRTLHIRKALEMAAESLALGQAIPKTAQDLIARRSVPAWMYRLFGAYGWRQRAKRFGAHRSLRRQPYATTAR